MLIDVEFACVMLGWFHYYETSRIWLQCVTDRRIEKSNVAVRAIVAEGVMFYVRVLS